MLPHAQKFTASVVAENYGLLKTFGELHALLRAIDRLGRSRTNRALTDKAIDLGMAAEIALMHGSQATNTEITNKLSMRAGWLLGTDVDGRMQASNDMRTLYGSRSDAVHRGVLPRKSKFDAAVADELVKRLLSAILRRGSFPDWDRLTLGG